MRDPNAAAFQEFPCGSTPGCFPPNYIPDRQLARSARFRTDRSLLSAIVEISGERCSTRRLDIFLRRLPIDGYQFDVRNVQVARRPLKRWTTNKTTARTRRRWMSAAATWKTT